MVDEEKGFEVTEEVEIGSLADVKEQRTLIPATRGVKFSIVKAETRASKDNEYRWLNLNLSLVDGIDGKYKGMLVFGRACYYANPEVYTKDYFKNKQHLVELKNLVGAVNLTDPTKVNDTFLSELVGQVVLGDIRQVKGRPYTDPEGNEITPAMQNEVVRFKKVPIEDMV